MSSCGNNSTSTVATSKSDHPGLRNPVYGGTLTVATDWMFEDPGGFDAGLTPNRGRPPSGTARFSAG